MMGEDKNYSDQIGDIDKLMTHDGDDGAPAGSSVAG